MKVLITGGNSAVGRSLTENLLTDGHKVVSFDIHRPNQLNSQINYIQGDVLDFDIRAWSIQCIKDRTPFWNFIDL